MNELSLQTRREFVKSVVALVGYGVLGDLLPGCTRTQQEAFLENVFSMGRAINRYRNQNSYRSRLAPIPISANLTSVGIVHCLDLQTNRPHETCGGNYHSWSSAYRNSGCYSSDRTTWPIMWEKPRELTDYPGKGYEIVAMDGSRATNENSIATWNASSDHRNVILNQDIWASRTWEAMGGIATSNFACVWFGEERDPNSVS